MESESEVAIKWFNDDHLIVNPAKFWEIIFDKNKGNHTNEIINIDEKEVKVISNVKVLGTEINDKLTSNRHIKNICKSASNQLKALIRLNHHSESREKRC